VGATLAMGNIFTVALAYPMQKRAGNPMPQPSQGYNGYAIAAVFGTLASSPGGRAPPDAVNLFSCEIRIYRYGASTGPSCLT
jgi:hypothetical protein